MKRLIASLATVVFVLSLALSAVAQEPAKSVSMQMYHVVALKQGPNWKSQGTEEGMDARMQVIDAVRKGAKSGMIVTAGLVNDETGVEFIIILNVETKTEAYKILEASPNYKNGMFAADIYSMFAPKGLVVEPKK